ncbi:MAG: ImmA/IrrE family metallo-endopeptidase [Bacillota bacterium]
MQVKYYINNGISKKALDAYALQIRRLFNYEFTPVLPVLEILDIMSSCPTFGSFDYQILEDNCTLFAKNELALFDYKNNMLYIKESVYNEASDGVGRARFTIAHELSHWFLFTIYNLYPTEETTVLPPAYREIEWQANYLAGVLLAPNYLCCNMSADDIANIFKVSPECATVRACLIK